MKLLCHLAIIHWYCSICQYCAITEKPGWHCQTNFFVSYDKYKQQIKPEVGIYTQVENKMKRGCSVERQVIKNNQYIHIF